MLSRRTFLGTLSAASLAPLAQNAFAKIPAPTTDPTQHVKIAIGTGGHGHTFPAATVPFGAVQLGPDTGCRDWDHCSGYHYDDKAILGFSHTHLSGTGCIDLMDFLLMPATDDFHFDPHAAVDSPESYRATFSHADEIATPGYYSVKLQESKVHAELTATERVGFHKYTFPASQKSCFLLDLTHSGINEVDPKHPAPRPLISWSSLRIVDNQTIVGGRSTNVWAMGRQLYFTMKFSKPFTSIDVYSEGNKLPTSTGDIKGQNLRAVLHFTTHANEVVQVKTGISAVSIEGATANIAAELPHWNFDQVRNAAHASWSKELNRIRITSGNQKYLEIFYTGLYHMMLAPTLFDDADGHYRGMDGKVHTLPPGAHNYSTFSFWDTYRALHPMYTLILGDRLPDLVNCIIRIANESPAGVPIWPLQGEETNTMVGYHSAPVVAEALVKGFKGIDAAAAYAPFRKRAMQDDFRGLAAYRKYGYVPCDTEVESASKTMDYAYDDRAVAALALAAGQQADHDLLMKRSKCFTNLYDKESGFIRPRYIDGHWAGPFNPRSGKVSGKRDYTEANGWQTTFCVQHDPQLLVEMLGGNAAFIAKLDEFFTMSSDLPPDMPPDVTGMVGQYAHGNEPCHHMAYLYNYAGAPHKTQARIRSLLETMYDNQPNGMAGNEDCGQMSAWFVISALGLYAVDPVSAKYDIGTPLFDRAELTVAPGKTLIIEAQRQSSASAFVHGLTWNNAPHPGLSIDHSELTQGGHLIFHLFDSPA